MNLLGSIFWHHRGLLMEVTRNELMDSRKGHFFGVFWVIFLPLVLVGVYMFVFSVVFKVRLAGVHQFERDYTIYLLAGLIPWFFSADVLGKSCGAILSQASLVRHVQFPLEVLPAATVLSSLVSLFFQIAILFLLLVVGGVVPGAMLFAVPVLIVIHVIGLIGVAFILSLVSVYVRDLVEIVRVFLVIGPFAAPILYVPGSIPSWAEYILWLNPFTHLTYAYQDVFFYGSFEHPVAWMVIVALAAGVFIAGGRVFVTVKDHIGDVL